MEKVDQIKQEQQQIKYVISMIWQVTVGSGLQRPLATARILALLEEEIMKITALTRVVVPTTALPVLMLIVLLESHFMYNDAEVFFTIFFARIDFFLI